MNDDISPELRERLRAHARRIAEAAPMATPEQIEQLRRWFGSDAWRARRDAA